MWKLSGKFHFFLRFCTRKRSETYILTHTQMTNTFDTKVILHNYIYIRRSRATLEFFQILGWLWYSQISNTAHGCRKSVNIRAILRYNGTIPELPAMCKWINDFLVFGKISFCKRILLWWIRFKFRSEIYKSISKFCRTVFIYIFSLGIRIQMCKISLHFKMFFVIIQCWIPELYLL